MSRLGDHLGEMRRHRHDLDAALEAVLAGRQTAGEHAVVAAAVVKAVRSAVAAPPPPPGRELATVLRGGFAIDNGGLPVTANSNDEVPATQVAGSPTRRRRRMLEIALAKLAALGLFTKLTIAGAAVAAATVGAGAADVLPGPTQDAFDRAAAAVTGQQLPDNAQVPDNAGPPTGVGGTQVEPDPEPVNEDVLDVIEGTDPEDRDREFGEEVSDTASQNRQDGDATVGGTGSSDTTGDALRDEHQPENPPLDTPAGS